MSQKKKSAYLDPSKMDSESSIVSTPEDIGPINTPQHSRKRGGLPFPISLILGLGILGLAALLVFVLFKFRPVAVKEAREKIIPVVEAITVQPENIVLNITAQGTLDPATSTDLAAEVGGKVIAVSPKFKNGGRFDEGETLLEIDPADYKASAAAAASTLADAKLALAQEEAKAEQAARDWKKLGRGEASELVLRVPQLASARARVDAAAAAGEKAERDLQRTKVTAPYKAVVRRKIAELGSFLAPGMPVATIYQNGPLEIRLAIPIDDAPYIDATAGTPVTLRSKDKEWQASIVRSEGEIDAATRSIYLVAEVPSGGENAPQPGLFVDAMIAGRSLDNLIKIPRRAFQGDNQLVVITSENTLQLRSVEVLRDNGTEALVSGGLRAGERVCTTALDTVIEGSEVKILQPKMETAPATPTASPAPPETSETSDAPAA